jgi:hypothetical protein
MFLVSVEATEQRKLIPQQAEQVRLFTTGHRAIRQATEQLL